VVGSWISVMFFYHKTFPLLPWAECCPWDSWFLYIVYLITRPQLFQGWIAPINTWGQIPNRPIVRDVIRNKGTLYDTLCCLYKVSWTSSCIWTSGACFSKVPKLFGPISGASIPIISSQRWASKPSNFAIPLVSLILKTRQKISDSKQADCN